MATCKVCGSEKPRFGACQSCEADALARQQELQQAERERQQQEEEQRKARMIRDRVKHHYDDFTGHHLLEATATVSFSSPNSGHLDGRIETLLQMEFTKDLSTDLVSVGFRRIGTDWRWMQHFNDQLFFILGGIPHHAINPYTYFEVIDAGVLEVVGFNPSEEQVDLMIADREWRVRAGFWEAKPSWPTHEVFQEARNRKTAILSSDST